MRIEPSDMKLSLAIAFTLSAAAVAPPNSVIPLLHSDLQYNYSFLQNSGKASRVFTASWRMRFGKDPGPGYAFLLGNKGDLPDLGPGDYPDWVHPSWPGFAVLFRARNPKTDNIFNGDGNIYDRPQREIALLWKGVEAQVISYKKP